MLCCPVSNKKVVFSFTTLKFHSNNLPVTSEVLLANTWLTKPKAFAPPTLCFSLFEATPCKHYRTDALLLKTWQPCSLHHNLANVWSDCSGNTRRKTRRDSSVYTRYFSTLESMTPKKILHVRNQADFSLLCCAMPTPFHRFIPRSKRAFSLTVRTIIFLGGCSSPCFTDFGTFLQNLGMHKY